MRELARGIRLLVATAWRVDRRAAIGVALESVGQALAPLIGVWLALITTGVLEKRGWLIVGGVTGMVLGAGIRELLTIFGTNWRLTLAEEVAHSFDTEVARLTASLPGLEHHERPEYADRLELLRQHQGALGQELNYVVNTANAIIHAAVVVILLTVVHPLLLLTAVLALPSLWVSRKQEAWRREAEDASATPGRLARQLRLLAYDRNAGMEIRVFGLQAEIARRVARTWTDFRRPLLRAELRSALLGGARELVFVAGVIAAIGFVLWRAFEGRATAGDVVLAVYVCSQVQGVVIHSIRQAARLGKIVRAAGRVRWLREYVAKTAAAHSGDRAAPDRLSDGIVLENVSFTYPGGDRPVLRDVSLRIPAGSVLAIVGENGAGKTTLVKLLARMYEPTRGRILVDGVDLATIDVDSWRRRLSAAFQDFARLEFIARQSIGVGDLERRDDDVAVGTALERAGVPEIVDALPAGLGTQLGAHWDTGVDLSTGQWQQLALGRALMRDPGMTDDAGMIDGGKPRRPLLMFFDEPTASLDAPTEHALFEKYAESARAGARHGMVTVLVSHRFSTVRAADTIVVLDGQQVLEHGTHEELLAAGALYAELYRLQERSYRTLP